MAQTDSSTYHHYTDRLLVLPKSDLKRRPTQGGAGDLVMVQCPLPLYQLLQTPNLQGVSVMASDSAAALITPNTSYTLTVVGTSNALVVWNPNDDKNDAEEDVSDTTSDRPAKRTKKDAQFCRLVQPGGSGANYWVGQERALSPSSVWELLSAARTSSQEWSTESLARHFLVSTDQVHQTMKPLACVFGKGSWYALSESNILLGRMAVVSALIDGAAELGLSANRQKLLDEVSKELDGLLQDLPDGVESATAATTFVQLAQLDHNGHSPASNAGDVQPETITRWVLEDILSKATGILPSPSKSPAKDSTEPETNMDDLLETVQSRLPVEETYQKLVTKDWLDDQLSKLGKQ